MSDLIVIGCGKQKLAAPYAKAIDLYTGPLFKAHRRLAESKGGPHYILSGLYGLVEPTMTIANYEATMVGAGKQKREEWSNMVLHQFRAMVKPTRLVVLCGKLYLGTWRAALVEDGWSIITPLAGLKVGERLSKVNQILGGSANG